MAPALAATFINSRPVQAAAIKKPRPPRRRCHGQLLRWIGLIFWRCQECEQLYVWRNQP